MLVWDQVYVINISFVDLSLEIYQSSGEWNNQVIARPYFKTNLMPCKKN